MRMIKDKLYPQIYNSKTLWQAWNRIKKKGSSGGIDGVSIENFEKNLKRNLLQLGESLRRGTYVPEPAKQVFISKNNRSEKRALALPVIKDKIVQEATRTVIEPLFNPIFLDFSYGYRPGKGPQKAIGRVVHYLEQKRIWTAVSDIDNFFDSIDHNKLLEFVSQKVLEKEILRLIKLWLKIGVVYHNKWIDVEQGVLQGNVISPLLSNIYLHPFDSEMDKKGYAMVRYADDFIFLEHTKKEALSALGDAGIFLEKQLHLKLNPESTSIRSINDGFVFLGFLFKGNKKTISAAKLEKIKTKIKQILKTYPGISETITNLNESINGWRNYYRIGDIEDQFQFLEDFLFHELKFYIIKAKNNFSYTENQIKKELENLEFFLPKSQSEKKKFISLLIASSRLKTLKQSVSTTIASVEQSIAAQKRKYEKILTDETDLVISNPGSFIGKTSRRVVVKEKGRRVKEIPFFRLKNIFITSDGISLSSNLVKYCSNESIPITFFDYYGKPYAQLLSPKFPLYKLTLAQVSAFNNSKGVHLAKSFAEGKIKNQINLIKYYRKYKARKEFQFAEKCEEAINNMKLLITKLKQTAAKCNELDSVRSRIFGIEGQAAAEYWGLIKLLISNDVYFERRERRGATDIVNSLLNYGYGILYSQIYQAIILAGLNPNISFLHKEQIGKPTLVFDLIEEFRQPIVDRAIIAIIRKGGKLSMEGVNLTQQTKNIIIKNIMKRINSRVNFRGERLSLRKVIRHQAESVAKFLEEKDKYRPFVDKW